VRDIDGKNVCFQRARGEKKRQNSREGIRRARHAEYLE
jgi:hypothetical protein